MKFTCEIEQLTDPAAEPLSLQEVKDHVGDLTDEFNTQLLSLITSARQFCEGITQASLAVRTYRAYFTKFEDELWIPTSPFVSVESVTYLDAYGVQQTLDPASYDVYAAEYVGLIGKAFNASWPDTRITRRAVAIDFTAGYSVLPGPVRTAMLLYISEQFENRKESVVGASVSLTPVGISANLAPYIRHSL